jgi:hypothetical protein
MAKTTFATGNALTKKAWEEKLYRDVIKESYFMENFSGEGSENILQVKNQLLKSQGDKITFGIRMRLAGAGQVEGGYLEGNEEALTTYDASVTLAQYRHAVRIRGKMDEQRAMFSIKDEARTAIKDWMTEKIDSLCFSAILSSPTRTAYRDGAATGAYKTSTSASTAKTGVHASYKINVGFLSFLRTYAKTGGNRSGMLTPIRPIKYKGKDYYVLLVHPDSTFDLKQDTTLQGAWQNARERGEDNPLFKNAICMWDGVLVHEHENCTIGTDAGAGSNVPYSKGVFMGAQALVWAWGEKEEVVQETFDYKNETGYGCGIIAGVTKPVFNSLDYGSLGVILARTQVSDS